MLDFDKSRPNSSLKVALPWNTRSHVPINGFHPLYNFLLENQNNEKSPENEAELLTLDELFWRDYLSKSDTKQSATKYFTSALRSLDKSSIEFTDFWSFFNINEILADEASDYDAKIVHTSLLATNLKPYIYHLESFETLFFPWQISNPFLKEMPPKKINAIKLFLQKKLEHPSCLAIVSHIKITLDRFKLFFDSEIINEKLVFSPLGIECPSLPIQRNAHKKSRRFVFSSSLHASIDNLVIRGLVTFFLFIDEWVKLFPDDEFVFMSVELGHELVSNYIDKELYDRVVNYKNVNFLGGAYISEKQLTALLSKSDYIFLLSYQLHSMSLLRSMALGVIPILIDLPEILAYGVNEENAVLVKIYNQLKKEKTPMLGLNPSMDSFIEETNKSIPWIVNYLSTLRATPEKERQLRENAHRLISTQNNASFARTHLLKLIRDRYWAHDNSDHKVNMEEKIKFEDEARFGLLNNFIPPMRPVTNHDFSKRTTYYPLLSLGSSTVFGNGMHYVTLPTLCSDVVSHLTLSFGDNKTSSSTEKETANLSYNEALNALLRNENSSGNFLINKLKSYIVERPKIKYLLSPLYEIYKKLIS